MYIVKLLITRGCAIKFAFNLSGSLARKEDTYTRLVLTFSTGETAIRPETRVQYTDNHNDYECVCQPLNGDVSGFSFFPFHFSVFFSTVS